MTAQQVSTEPPATRAGRPTDDEPSRTPVDDPAALVRITAMLDRVGAELREIDLDRHTVDRIEQLHHDVLEALTDHLDGDLTTELQRLIPALDRTSGSAADVRVAHLLLVGWLQGVFQGLHLTAIGRETERRRTATGPADHQRPGKYL